MRIELSHTVTSVVLDDALFLGIALEVKNIGPVVAQPISAYTLVQMPPSLPADGSKEPFHAWKTLHRIEFDFLADHLCIEPGDTVRYSRDVTLDAATRYVQLYSRTSLGVDRWHTDETSMHKLDPVPAVAASAQQASVRLGVVG